MKNILFFLPFLFIEDVFGKTNEMVTVVKGDSVTLHTGLTEIASDDVLDWSFGETRDLIARLNKATKNITIYNVLDGRFSGRLKVDSQTGDLTIRNIKTTDTGIYEVESTYNKATGFNVSVEQYNIDERQSVSVLLGDTVTLNTDATDMQIYDLIQWRYKQHFIAEISRTAGNISTFDGPDKSFQNRLHLNYLTGSLTITNIGTIHSGLYAVDIRSRNRHTIHRTFSVTVSDQMKSLSVMKADLVTLNTDTDLQTYDVMLWMFGDIFIAEIHKATELFYTYNGPDLRFKNRLELDRQTGSLNIKNITAEHAGLFDLKISNSKHTIHKRIIVAVNEMKSLSVMKGESLPLLTETEIQRDDLIMWKFGDTQIAEMHITEQRFSTSLDGRFRDRLKLDPQTGSLNITNTKVTDSGLYELKISSSRRTVHKKFTVTVTELGLSPGAVAGIVVVLLLLLAAAISVIYYRHKIAELQRKKIEAITVTEESIAPLRSGVIKIQRDDVVQWMFRDEQFPIAQIKEGQICINDGRFKGRLTLDSTTGSLTITDTRTTDSGHYTLNIISSGTSSTKLYSLTVTVETISKKEGDPVILTTKAEIERDDQMLLLFGEQELCIGQIKGGTEDFSTYDRFKGRLELNKKTRSVNITNTSTTDSGLYKLLIIGSGKFKSKMFSVTVSGDTASRGNRPEELPLMGVDVSNSRL